MKQERRTLVHRALALAVGIGIASTGGWVLAKEVEQEGSNTRETSSSQATKAALPQISFIDSPAPTCDKPDYAVNDCYIRFYYNRVDAGDGIYMKYLRVEINGKIRANHQGFFQQVIFIPDTMYSRGFWVGCGVPGLGGDPNLGKAHSIVIRAEDSSGLKSTNYATVLCPYHEQ